MSVETVSVNDAALGDSDENTRLLGEALALYREIGANGHAERLASIS